MRHADKWLEMKKSYDWSHIHFTASWLELPRNHDKPDVLWTQVLTDIRMSHFLVLYIEEGDLPLQGALVEVGMALAYDVPVFIVAPAQLQLNNWTGHPLVRQRVQTLQEALPERSQE